MHPLTLDFRLSVSPRGREPRALTASEPPPPPDRKQEMLQNDLFAACGLSVTATTMDAVNGLLRKVRICARSGSSDLLTRKEPLSGPRANAPHVQWPDHVPFPRQRRSQGVRQPHCRRVGRERVLGV